MSISYQGIVASQGIVIGKILKLEELDLKPIEGKITDQQVAEEKQKLKDGIKIVRAELQALADSQEKSENTAVFLAHLSILEDPYFEDTIIKEIVEKHNNVQMALSLGEQEISAQFLALEDEYLRERVADFRDVSGRIMRILKNVKETDLSKLDDEVVLAARDLSPSQTATMDLEKILGFVTDFGGRTSHTAIMARSMDIPALVGCQDLFSQVSNGDNVILDAIEGKVYVNPSAEEIESFHQKILAFQENRERLNQLVDSVPETKDGHRVEVAANAGSLLDVKTASKKGIDGIGLFRTEFLYMDSTHFPTEEEQFSVYRQVAETMEDKPVIIRTLDIGGDKSLSYYEFDPELNPFMGYRAIRLCLDQQDIFKVQLRAILRASTFGKIRIMFPMIISIEELKQSKEILETCKKELDAEQLAYDKKIEVGIMIETPATVIMADTFAKYVDFFSIGTNDLTQYTLAVDRGNEKIQNLYNSFHPAVLKSVYQVIQASHKAGKWTGMCGEFAGDSQAIALLLGMGLDEFSMSASAVLQAKEIIISSDYQKAQKLVEEVLAMETAAEIEEYLKLHN